MAFALNFENLITTLISGLLGIIGTIIFLALIWFVRRSWFLIGVNVAATLAVLWPWFFHSSIF